MAEMEYFEDDTDELGISPLGRLLVILSCLIGIVLFLDPNSATYDIAIGGVIIAGTAIAFGPAGLQRFENEGDLRTTFLLGLVGAGMVSAIAYVIYTIEPLSTVQGSMILILALPAIFEELVFRAGVYLAIKRYLGKWLAVGVQAFLFALYHFTRNPDLPYTILIFFAGVVFQLIFLASRNILSSMLSHGLLNLKPLYLAILYSPFTVVVAGAVLIVMVLRRRFSNDG